MPHPKPVISTIILVALDIPPQTGIKLALGELSIVINKQKTGIPLKYLPNYH